MNDMQSAAAQECNCCGSTRFIDWADRRRAICEDCNSVERTRAMQLFIDHFKLARPGMRALHFAPDAGISRRLREAIGAGYEACDIDPERYASSKPRRFDLTTQAEELPSRTYHLIVHSHVMEHLLCDYTAVLYHLHRSLTDDGVHLFCIPIKQGHYASDLDPHLSDAERRDRFFQHDHVRRFGSEDLQSTLGMIFKLPAEYDIQKTFPVDLLLRYNIPASAWRGFTPDTIFMMRKHDMKLAAP